ncbi:hypothetical protein [Piscinibacter sp.]|uniref:hypothetical protein n=1 Tax=Piscinibacter sp. TaxID=1903157 RepID=UPI0039E4BAD4
MDSDLFQPTLPLGEPELMRASAYQRYLDELRSTSGGISTRISQLSPSLRADLLRFGDDGGASEVVEVVAACVRHGKRVTIHIQTGERVVPLTVFARERLVHCPVPPQELVGKPLLDLKVMHVEPALLQPPGEPGATLVGAEDAHYPLAPLLWELAMRGLRRELLPEIAGPAVYRVAPGLDTDSLPASGAVMAAVQRLARQGASLKELSDWPGMDRERATRLLNALYLQSGLIISRSHPDAGRDGWF